MEWIKGSDNKQVKKFASDDSVYGTGAMLEFSTATWHTLIQQAWLTGLLHRTMQIGRGHSRISSMVFNTYSLSETGENYIQAPQARGDSPISLWSKLKHNAYQPSPRSFSLSEA